MGAYGIMSGCNDGLHGDMYIYIYVYIYIYIPASVTETQSTATRDGRLAWFGLTGQPASRSPGL